MNSAHLAFKNPMVWMLVFLSIIIFNIVDKSPITCASSDPRWTLLTAQSIIEDGTIKLDKYADSKDGYMIRKDNQYGYAIMVVDGHMYNYFPIGSSLSSLPFVWFETQVLGKHMKIHSYNANVHMRIAAFVAVGIFLLLYLIASMYIPNFWSAVVAVLFWAGTSYASTLGNGLWSHTFGGLYGLLALYFALRLIQQERWYYWGIIGFTLFMTYLTRPTFSLYVIALLLFIFANKRKAAAVKSGLVILFLMGIFVLFSMYEFHQILPSYYAPKRLSSDDMWEALYANTLSPSRGIFVFSPFLLLFFLLPLDTLKIFKTNKTLLIIAGWVVAHYITVSKFPHWSGGWCYGSRFMSDALLGIFLLFVLLLQSIYLNGSKNKKIWVSIFLVVTIIFSMYVHITKGMYDKYSATEWNRFPAKDDSLFFDWKYPQFFHTKERQIRRGFDYNLAHLNPINIGEKTPFSSESLVLFPDWHMEPTVAWSIGKEPILYFAIDAIDDVKGKIKIRLGTYNNQSVTLILNGHRLGTKVFNSFLVEPKNSWDADVVFYFDPKILNKDRPNTLKFELPLAAPRNDSSRAVIAIAIKSIEVE